MPRAKIDYVVSFSSEDKEHPASNLVATEISKKRWVGAHKGETSNSVVLQLAKSVQISSVHIGSYDSAFVEVLVGRSETPNEPFKVLIPSSIFLTPADSKKGEGTSKVRTFNFDQLASDTRTQSWDRIRVVCRQPYNKHCKYGLNFIHIFEPEGSDSRVRSSSPEPVSSGKNYTQRFDFNPQSSEDEESFKPGELFEKLKNKGHQSIESQIRQASTPTALKNVTSLQDTLVKTPINKDKKTQNNIDNDDQRRRHRDDLMYNEDDIAHNSKIDKIIQRNNEEKERKRIEETKRELRKEMARKDEENSTKDKNKNELNESRDKLNESRNKTEEQRDKTNKHRDDRNDSRENLSESRNITGEQRDKANKHRDDRNDSRDKTNNHRNDRNESRDRSSKHSSALKESRDRSSDKREKGSDRRDRSRDRRDRSSDGSKRDRNRSKDRTSDQSSKKRQYSGSKERNKENHKRLKMGEKTDSPHTLMEGVVFVMSGYVNPQRAKLRDMAVAMGAKYKQDWGRGCTHLICAFPNTPKLKQARSENNSVIAVTSEWIEQCCKEKRMLPWQWFATEPKRRVSRDDYNDDVLERKVDDDECDTDDEIEKVLQRQLEAESKKTSTSDDAIKDEPMNDESPMKSSQESDVAFVKDERIKESVIISDDDLSTDEENILPAEKIELNKKKCLPAFFDDRLFAIDEKSCQKYDIDMIKRYITAYGGDFVNMCIDGTTVDYIIATDYDNETSKNVKFKRIVRPEWIWECHDREMKCEIDDYLIEKS